MKCPYAAMGRGCGTWPQCITCLKRGCKCKKDEGSVSTTPPPQDETTISIDIGGIEVNVPLVDTQYPTVPVEGDGESDQTQTTTTDFQRLRLTAIAVLVTVFAACVSVVFAATRK
jgi:hypothetical protein